jgi:hypothetical protein
MLLPTPVLRDGDAAISDATIQVIADVARQTAVPVPAFQSGAILIGHSLRVLRVALTLVNLIF